MVYITALDRAPLVGSKKHGAPVHVPSSVEEICALRPRRLEKGVGRRVARRGGRRNDQDMGSRWGVSNGVGRE